MATLYISEYSVLGQDGAGGLTQAAQEPNVTTQTVSYTTATQSNALDDATRFVRLIADAEAFLEFGTNPTATSSSMKLPAETVEYFAVSQGNEIKISVYDGTS